MATEIDPFPVAALQDRYQIGKQAVYNRLDALSIKTFKRGNKSYITANDLRELDQLHLHVKSGGKMDDFKSPRSQQISSPVDRLDKPSGQIDTSIEEIIALVEAIARHLRPAKPLLHLEELEQAAAAGWLLSSSEVEKLIGCKPRVKKGDRQFTRGSFCFVKSGKIGHQSAWKVVKTVDGLS